MFILQSIPYQAKTGWFTETIPMHKKQADALLKRRLAENAGDKKRRYRLIKS